MTPVLIALGSNLGDRFGHLSEAVMAIADKMWVQDVSSIVESAPMYLTDQPSFYNAVLIAKTKVGPRETLGQLKDLETKLGRSAGVRNGPREIDLDMIAYGNLAYIFRNEGRVVLQVPHPRAFERAFVLKPAAEVCAGFMLPGLGTVGKLLDNLGDAADSAQVRPDAVLPLHRI
jgi:2-amino-4-hydroxy-6-hydroxymethyldihydropteridine diphosphokinase